MSYIVLTQYDGAILGPIAKLIGVIINYLYLGLSNLFGIENIGVTIIVFTIVVYTLMIPLTYKQQKFSKVTTKMNPELKKIQDKYKGKTDQASRLKMNEETTALYDKYGVSPTGSCLPLIIQFPILLAVYRVVYNVPAYVSSIKDVYLPLVKSITSVNGYQKIINNIATDLNIRNLKISFEGATKEEASNLVVDLLSKLPTDGWTSLSKAFPDLTNQINSLQNTASHFNDFLGLDIANSPFDTIKTAFPQGSFVIVILAILIPIISGATQFLNMKLSMASQDKNMVNDNPAMKQMQSMNYFMPLFSVVMVFTLPIGLGIYWIAGAVVRSIQQFFLNKHFDKLDFDAIIESNREKAAEKKAKREGYTQEAIIKNGHLSTRNINSMSNADKEEALRRAEELKANAKPDSMAYKANLVRDFNNRNSNQ